MRNFRFVMVLVVIVAVALAAGALGAKPPRDSGCVPCGKEFKNVQPSSCGIAENPVEAYRANGAFVGVFSSRCHACTTKGVFCTLGPR